MLKSILLSVCFITTLFGEVINQYPSQALLDSKIKVIDIRTFQEVLKRGRELRVAIHEQVAGFVQKPIDRIGEIPGHLFHPCFLRIGGTTGEVNPTTGDLHDEQQVERYQPALRPHLDRREIDGRQDVPVRLEKGRPRGLPFSFWRGLDAVRKRIEKREAAKEADKYSEPRSD